MLNFNMRYKDYEVKACPRGLARFSDDVKNETIDFVKRYEYKGRDLCYSIGYFWWNRHEHCWELKFVGERFCEIEGEDIKPVWEMLKAAYNVLDAWMESEDGN